LSVSAAQSAHKYPHPQLRISNEMISNEMTWRQLHSLKICYVLATFVVSSWKLRDLNLRFSAVSFPFGFLLCCGA